MADAPEQKLEKAVIDLLQAKDSRGLKVRLHSGPYTSSAFAHSLRLLPLVSDESDLDVALQRNRRLLSACYNAALECERHR